MVGAGAIGSFCGGMLAKASEDVTLIDGWPEHITKLKTDGLMISGTQGTHRIAINALHIHECQSLLKRPADVAFVCTKSYDTGWATMLIKDYLAPSGFVVSLQNGMNEERIAAIVGWGRTMGCIASAIGVEIAEAGHVRRTYRPGGEVHTIFRVGEVHGRITPRAEQVRSLLAKVDSAKVSTNLWGERWSKLVVNAMNNPVEVISGLSDFFMARHVEARRVMIRLAGEAVAVGEALGYTLEPIFGVDGHAWTAGTKEGGDVSPLHAAIEASAETSSTETARSSTAQDFLKGRRLEVDSFNGLIVRRGNEVGIGTPAHRQMLALIDRVQRGERKPGLELLKEIQ
jgi:2-dehydropantoate 2-reductase